MDRDHDSVAKPNVTPPSSLRSRHGAGAFAGGRSSVAESSGKSVGGSAKAGVADASTPAAANAVGRRRMTRSKSPRGERRIGRRGYLRLFSRSPRVPNPLEDVSEPFGS